MTKKHFEAIAHAILQVRNTPLAWDSPTIAFLAIEQRIADVCAQFNPRFDRKRFLDACRGDK